MNKLQRFVGRFLVRLGAPVLGALVFSVPALAQGEDEAVRTHHIHQAVSHAGEAIKWYQLHLGCSPDAQRPKLANCGGMSIEFVERQSLGSSQGTGVNHISFSVADLKAKMAELEGVGVGGAGVRLQRFPDGATVQSLAGLYPHAFIFDPWGTRIELVQDAEKLGFHHIHLDSADPNAALKWYESFVGTQRSRHKNQVDGLLIEDVWLLFSQHPEGTPATTEERAIDHIAFVMGNLDGAAQRFQSTDVRMEQPAVPANARSAAKRAFVAGPDGVLIALVEPQWAGVADGAAVAALNTGAVAKVLPFAAPQTPWGEPDLQGMWTGNAAHGIPLERPEEDQSDATNLTVADAAARRERGTLGSIWGYEREWRDTTLGYDKSAPSTQVAMIIDPPNGRMPPMTEKGLRIAAETLERRENPTLAAGPEDLSTWVRCITRGLPNMMLPAIYNNGLQISQSPGYVAIQKEMIHETRVIPISDAADAPHASPELKQWLGSARGHWDGDSLVIVTKGFNGRTTYQGAGENLMLTERYRRVGANKLEYTFTVDDNTIWTAPWTAMFHFELDNDQYELVEYACHEGNYGMTNILSGARAKEQQNTEPAGE